MRFPRRSLAPSFAGQALRFRQQALERDILETESAQMMSRVLEVLEARAAVAAALEDQSHHRIVVESTGVLAMTAVDHEGHGPDEALAGFRAAPACTIDAGHHLALKKVVERLLALGRRHATCPATARSDERRVGKEGVRTC